MFIRQFRPVDLSHLAIQPAQGDMAELLENPQYGIALASAGPAFTAEHNGVILGCAGAMEHHPKRAEMWALLSDSASPFMRQITRAANGWIRISGYPRIEANVATDFLAGHRWVSLLGFHQEGPERLKFFPDGRSAVTYVRIQ